LAEGSAVAVRGWQLVLLVAAALVGLVLAGRLAAPPPAAPPAASPPVATGPSCDPDHITSRPAGARDGPRLHPPVAGLRLDPATARPGDLPAGRAEALARALVGSEVDSITTRARLLRVTRPPGLHDRRAWVVAVAGVPAGMGFCGPVGSREVVVVLDAATGHPLWRYSYR
jgi:hypothetical protein